MVTTFEDPVTPYLRKGGIEKWPFLVYDEKFSIVFLYGRSKYFAYLSPVLSGPCTQ